MSSRLLDVQRTAGNRGLTRLLAESWAAACAATGGSSSRHEPAPVVQRQFTLLPLAHVAGDNAATAQNKLKTYVTTGAVATGGLTFNQELDRVKGALATMQPSKVAEVESRLKAMGMKADPQQALSNAAKLQAFVTYVNQVITDFHLDAQPASVTGQVLERDGTKHHMDYFFQLPGDQDANKFDLDEWSRKGTDFLGNASAGPVIQGIVNEAVRGWDLKTSIVSLLVARLLGPGAGGLSATAAPRNVNALFMNSPVGHNYTKILLAAENIVGVRVKDLTARDLKVQHWKKTAKQNIDVQSFVVDWPAFLRVARTNFKAKMIAGTVADENAVRNAAVTAIVADDSSADLRTLRDLGVLDMDGTTGAFKLNSGQKSKGNDVYKPLTDDRFGFDISHFKAILFFEWKAVSDLQR